MANPGQPRHRGGRHRSARSRRWGRAASLTLLSVLLPGSVALGIAWFFVRTHQPELLRLLVDPAGLLTFAIGLGVGWALWLALICRTYVRTRPSSAPMPARLAGIVAVVMLCGAVTMPMAMGARYAVAQRELITTVFSGERTATTPARTLMNPWGDRTRVNVLLLGGDGAIGRDGVRTDSVILASIDVKTGEAIMFSLPRNLRSVPFPEGTSLAGIYPEGFDGPVGSGSEAEYFLNAVYRNVPALHPGIHGRSENEGADAVKMAVSGALGIPVDYYVLVNLRGFELIVDAIGGISVNINAPVPIGGNGDAGIPPEDYLEPGPNRRLDGFEALWFSRGRYGSSDYNRMERQRCALNAIAAEADPLNLLRRYTDLAAAGKKIVRTDIPRKLLPAFVALGRQMKGGSLRAVGFERTEEFDPNEPDYDYMQRSVAAALRPDARTSPAKPLTTKGPTFTADPIADRDLSGTDLGSADLGSLTDAADDCGYHPELPGAVD